LTEVPKVAIQNAARVEAEIGLELENWDVDEGPMEECCAPRRFVPAAVAWNQVLIQSTRLFEIKATQVRQIVMAREGEPRNSVFDVQSWISALETCLLLGLWVLAESAETVVSAEFVAIAETAVPAIVEAAALDVITEYAQIVEFAEFVGVAQIVELAVSVEVAVPVEIAVLAETAVIVVTAGYDYAAVQAFPIQLWALVAAL